MNVTVLVVYFLMAQVKYVVIFTHTHMHIYVYMYIYICILENINLRYFRDNTFTSQSQK